MRGLGGLKWRQPEVENEQFRKKGRRTSWQSICDWSCIIPIRWLTFMTQRNIPTPLSVVSYLFLLMGIMSVAEIIGELTSGSFRFDFGVLGIGIFFGLRRYSAGWRRCALWFIWLGMIGLAVAFVYGFLGGTGQPSSRFSASVMRTFRLFRFTVCRDCVFSNRALDVSSPHPRPNIRDSIL